jgi:hypothetical protein
MSRLRLSFAPVASALVFGAIVAAPRSAKAQTLTLPYSQSCSSTGFPCFEIQTSGAGESAIHGQDTDGSSTGVFGETTSGAGLLGKATTGYGVESSATSGKGVYSTATTGYGGYFTASGANSTAVYASGVEYGIYGTSGTTGVYGTSTAASLGVGVYGLGGGLGYGVLGKDTSSTGIGTGGAGTNGAIGVFGQSDTGAGVEGTSTSGNGVYGSTAAGGASGGFFDNTGSGGNDVGCAGESTNGYGGYFITTNGTYSAYFNKDIYVNGASLGPSDIRYKKNVKPIEGAIDQLLRLKGVTFEWKEPEKHDDLKGTQIGFIAQDVENVFPGWVRTDKDGFKALTVAQIEGLEVESIRTLKAKNDDLEARLKALEESRRPVVSMNANGIGFGVAGLAVAAAIVVSRRKKSEDRTTEN